MLAISFMHYNFCRIHQTLQVAAAMEEGLTEDVSRMVEIIGLIA